MSAAGIYGGGPIDTTHSQLTNVDFVRWLLKPETKASRDTPPPHSPSQPPHQSSSSSVSTASSSSKSYNNTSTSVTSPITSSTSPISASPQAVTAAVAMEGNQADGTTNNSDAQNDGTSKSTPETSAQSPTTDKPVKQISCTQCQVRKIKCDKAKPSCSHCIKSKLGPCEYRPPAPPRRGKRKPTEADLVSRLRRCEELLRNSGIHVDENGFVNGGDSSGNATGDNEPASKKRSIVIDGSNPDSPSNSAPPSRGLGNVPKPHGKIIVEEGGSRYVESDLWRGIGAETNQADPRKLSSIGGVLDDSHADVLDPHDNDFLFDCRGSQASLASFHPSTADASILWNIFLDNVEPLLKMLHIPTFEQEMWDAAQNVVNIPSAMEALMFAIYILAVGSMPAAECEKSFGIRKTVLLARFETAIKKAFVKAQVLISTDFRLVQAMVIWLHSIRDSYHPHALWILSGVALRMAQRAGIHREKALANFSVFDAEMRRRTWWALMAIDSRAAELSGSGISVFHNAHDTEIPGNYNDRDLSPDMTELPPSRSGATEMIFVSLRHEVAKFYKDNLPRTIDDNNVSTFACYTDAKIDAFEHLLEHKFLRFCDALYPLHYMTSVVGRACIGTMRLVAHHPVRYANGAKDMSEEEKDSLYEQSMKLVRYQHLIHSTPALSSRYLWHCDAYFPWHAFIYIITTICKAGDPKRATESWELVEKTFEIYPKMINDTRRPLHVALGNLIIKAWDATGQLFPVDKARSSMMSPISPTGQYNTGSLPDFIIKLRAQRAPQIMPKYPTQHIGTSPSPVVSSRPSQPTTPGLLAQNTMGYNGNVYSTPIITQNYSGSMHADVPSFDVVDLSPEAWQEWDKLLVSSQTMDFSSDYQNAGSWSMYRG